MPSALSVPASFPASSGFHSASILVAHSPRKEVSLSPALPHVNGETEAQSTTLLGSGRADVYTSMSTHRMCPKQGIKSTK